MTQRQKGKAMINFFLKVFVLFSGVLTSFGLALVIGFEAFDALPNTETNGLFGIASYPMGDDYLVVISAIVSVIVFCAGMFATVVAFERISESE